MTDEINSKVIQSAWHSYKDIPNVLTASVDIMAALRVLKHYDIEVWLSGDSYFRVVNAFMDTKRISLDKDMTLTKPTMVAINSEWL